MSDKIVRLNDHRDAFAPPVIEEFLRTGLLLPNLRDGILQSMDAEHARARQVLVLTFLAQGQEATVLQLPAAAVDAKAPQRAAYV